MKEHILCGTLPNGIRYICTHTDDSDKSVGIFIRVHYGTAFDKKAGLAHLLEHLLFKGTKARPRAKDILRQFNSIGADWNAYTDYQETAYYSKCAHVHLEKNLELLCDMLTGTDFGAAKMEREFRHEKTVVAEELKSILDNPKQYIGELVRKNLFAGKLARNVNDSLAALPGITLADVIATYRQYYVGRNIVVSLNGNLSECSPRTMLYEFLGRLPRGRANNKLFRATNTAAAFATRPILRQISRSKNITTKQTVIQITYPVQIQQRQQYYYISLFQLVFADLTSGRLFQTLREKHGLIYSVKAHFVKHDDVGYFAIKTTTTTTPANVARVLAILHKEIARVQQGGLSQAEFTLAKANFLATWAMAEEDVMTPAAFHGAQLFYANTNTKHMTLYSDVPRLIDKITLTNINAFIARLLSKPAIVTLL